jgi:hypothetical protein
MGGVVGGRKLLWSCSSAGKIGLITSSVSRRERCKPLAELRAEQLRPVASGQASLSALMIALLKHVLKLLRPERGDGLWQFYSWEKLDEVPPSDGVDIARGRGRMRARYS